MFEILENLPYAIQIQCSKLSNYSHSLLVYFLFLVIGVESHSLTESPQHLPEYCNLCWYPGRFPVVCLCSCISCKWSQSHCGRLCFVWDICCTVVWPSQFFWYILQVIVLPSIGCQKFLFIIYSKTCLKRPLKKNTKKFSILIIA